MLLYKVREGFVVSVKVGVVGWVKVCGNGKRWTGFLDLCVCVCVCVYAQMWCKYLFVCEKIYLRCYVKCLVLNPKIMKILQIFTTRIYNLTQFSRFLAVIM